MRRRHVRASPATVARIALLCGLIAGQGVAEELAPIPGDGDTPPSIALIVIDTLRFDAVSSYGSERETTPNLDRLAREGLLFERAYASSSWTLPSHATIFSGLRVHEHRAGMPGRPTLPEDLVTLAERLAEAGYETVAISENAMISDVFGMLQGFEYKRASGFDHLKRPIRVSGPEAVEEWLAGREPGRPFFLFVNLSDPHDPYKIRTENPFVPPDATRSEIESRPRRTNSVICGALPTDRQIEILRGLYLGEVAHADAETGRILRALRAHLGDAPLRTIATSDHGEYFGKRKLMGHYFGLDEAVLRIPMIVSGDGVERGGRVAHPVGLIDLAPTILAWAGVEAPEGWHGMPLPRRAPEPNEVRPPRPLAGAFSDDYVHLPEDWKGRMRLRDTNRIRQFCVETDPVWGGMATLIRYPWKFHWFENYPPELYDLGWDPYERSNQARMKPDLVEAFSREIEEIVADSRLRTDGEGSPTELSEEARTTLRALGYVE